jgi:hypothetical protein
MNKPWFHDESWPQAWDPGNPLRALRGGGDGGDLIDPVDGALDARRRPLHQAFRPPLAGLGGRAWGWRARLPPLPCVALVLLLFPLMADCGSEELGEGSSGASGFPSTQVLRHCA